MTLYEQNKCITHVDGHVVSILSILQCIIMGKNTLYYDRIDKTFMFLTLFSIIKTIAYKTTKAISKINLLEPYWSIKNAIYLTMDDIYLQNKMPLMKNSQAQVHNGLIYG